MAGNYMGTWESVKKHQVPEWYEDCKFGIFIHWGIYSVPAFAPRTWELGEVDGDEEWFCNNPYAEWYYNSVNVGKGPTYEHHLKKYGKDFKYEDFIPQWRAENWNPAQWAELFQKAGARYVVLTTKHHDGFCLYDSAYTDFNTTVMGPKRDITEELTEAVREAGLKMGLYYSGLIDWQFANDPIFYEEQNFGNACPTFEYADYSYNQMKERSISTIRLYCGMILDGRNRANMRCRIFWRIIIIRWRMEWSTIVSMVCTMILPRKNIGRVRVIGKKSGRCAAVWAFLSVIMKMREMTS